VVKTTRRTVSAVWPPPGGRQARRRCRQRRKDPGSVVLVLEFRGNDALADDLFGTDQVVPTGAAGLPGPRRLLGLRGLARPPDRPGRRAIRHAALTNRRRDALGPALQLRALIDRADRGVSRYILSDRVSSSGAIRRGPGMQTRVKRIGCTRPLGCDRPARETNPHPRLAGSTSRVARPSTANPGGAST
jgi:hypothetical protein